MSIAIESNRDRELKSRNDTSACKETKEKKGKTYNFHREFIRIKQK